MNDDRRPAPPRPQPDARVPVAEIRDYTQINAHLVQALDRGARVVRLVGVDGQRLLAFRLQGPWNAVIEIDGQAGPELAAELNAPALQVVALQGAADGAGRALSAGRILLLGPAGDALGYGQSGGAILAARGAGARAGLAQNGGLLVIDGPIGPLAADRQSAGLFWSLRGPLGPHPARGRLGGRLLAHGFEAPSDADLATLRDLTRGIEPWLADPNPHP